MGIRASRRANRKSVVPAKKPSKTELARVLPGHVEPSRDPNEPFAVKMEWDDVRETAAKLYGRGYRRTAIARALLDHLYPQDGKARTEEQKMSSVTQKLRRWEYSQEFRDLVWKYAVVDLDMDTPAILTGLSKRAKRGRVDAARLALELTGRHSKESENGPVNVTVNLANVARPDS
jgi:hypothetical protein